MEVGQGPTGGCSVIGKKNEVKIYLNLNFIISDIFYSVKCISFNRCKREIFAPHLDPLERAGFDHWIIHISLIALCVAGLKMN
jgi:hypothetical protein